MVCRRRDFGHSLVFLLVAGIIAKERGIKTLVGGMCETDFSGYPDCRDDSMKAMQVALNLGLQANLTIETPLMFIDKSQTWKMAYYDLGGSALVNTVVNHSHTCYENDREHVHAWGVGCGASRRLQAAGSRLGAIYQGGGMRFLLALGAERDP